MAKRGYSKKSIAKKAAKQAFKSKKNFLIAIVIVIALTAVAIGAYLVYKNNHPEHSFVLNGDNVVTVALNEETYVEKGAKATYKDKDVSDNIVIKYHADSKEGEVLTSIPNNERKTYFVEYHVEYEKMNETIYRTVNVTDIDPIRINFLELGNHNTGDCTYIKAGTTDILIDAGSKTNSSTTVVNYLKEDGNISDNIIEYLVVTHAHEDHIAALVGTSANPGVLDTFTVKNIIQFSRTEVTSNLYHTYQEKVQKQVDNGAKLFKAGDLVQSGNNVINIGKQINITILDQKYYYEDASTENDYSVATLITHGTNNYLFTGDLEKKGEESLTTLNELPHCQLFKGGHHGSKTSNNDVLLSKITPDVICICCCAGNDEYTKTPENMFPCQEAINRMAKYTENIFVTTLSTDGKSGYTSMNGIITFTSKTGTNYEVHGSNNDTILKETTWFKSNRTWPSFS